MFQENGCCWSPKFEALYPEAAAKLAQAERIYRATGLVVEYVTSLPEKAEYDAVALIKEATEMLAYPVDYHPEQYHKWLEQKHENS